MDTRTDAATSRPLRPDKKRAARKTKRASAVTAIVFSVPRTEQVLQCWP